MASFVDAERERLARRIVRAPGGVSGWPRYGRPGPWGTWSPGTGPVTRQGRVEHEVDVALRGDESASPVDAREIIGGIYGDR